MVRTGMIESLDVHAAPDKRFGRQALLHARGQGQVFLDFLVALFEFPVRVAQFLLGAFDIGNVSEGDDRIVAAFGVFDDSRADDDRQTRSVFARQNKFEAVVAVADIALALRNDEIGFVFGIHVVNIQADEFFPGTPLISSRLEFANTMAWHSSVMSTPSFKLSRMPSICSSQSGCSTSTDIPLPARRAMRILPASIAQ